MQKERKWLAALRHVLPLYVGVILAGVMVSVLAVLITQNDYDTRQFHLFTLWQQWNKWDTGHFIQNALNPYSQVEETAFFPLYPLLIRGFLFLHLIHNPLIVGLLISAVSLLIALVVLYQLMCEELDAERADRMLLYIIVFPTAGFLLAAYSESLFLCLAVLSFYNIRHGHWWLAGLFGLFASLTRSAGLFLAIPFLYEYLRQHTFRFTNLKSILRLDILSIMLIPLGTALFAFYCYSRFGDALAFTHVQVIWGRVTQVPWYGINETFRIIFTNRELLSFVTSRNLMNLIPVLGSLGVIVLGFVGPWRLSRTQWSYVLYTAVIWLFINLVPISDGYPYPLASMARYLVALFPIFMIMANLGKNRFFHLSYLFLSAPVAVFILIQFLHGLWAI